MKTKPAVNPFTFAVISAALFELPDSLRSLAVDDKGTGVMITGDLVDTIADYDIYAMKADGEIYLGVGCKAAPLAVWKRIATKLAKQELYFSDDDAPEPPTLMDVPTEVEVDGSDCSYNIELLSAERQAILARAVKEFEIENADTVNQAPPMDRVLATIPLLFDKIEKHFAPRKKAAKKVTKGKKAARKR